jgi:hypothetical protein
METATVAGWLDHPDKSVSGANKQFQLQATLAVEMAAAPPW